MKTVSVSGQPSIHVAGDGARLRSALIFAPTPAIAHEPPLHGEPNAIVERAREQFEVFAGRLKAAGIETNVLDDAASAAFSPFGADGAVVFPGGAFLMRPSDAAARAAMPALRAFLEGAGIPIVGAIEAPGVLDGGDVLFDGRAVFIGVVRPRRAENGLPRRARGNDLGREQLAAFARAQGFEVVSVALAAEVRRLRSVASFVDDSTAIVAAGIVDAASFAGRTLVEVPRGEDYAAGALALGERRVVANLRFRESLPEFRRRKLVVDAIDLWEFGKTGAAPSSMVLALARR